MSDFDFDHLTDAINRAWHMCTLRGVRLLRADAGQPRFHEVSGSVVVPLDDKEAIGLLAQVLFERDPSGLEGNVEFEAVARAAARAGHPVRRPYATQSVTGEWWRRGSRVAAPKDGAS